MKNKKIILIVILCILSCIAVYGFIIWMFYQQYNPLGVSHLLVITIDPDQEKEYIAELENHKVYIEKLSIEGTNFRTFDAENLSIKDAIENNLVSIADWRKSAWHLKKEGEAEIYQYENYEILVTSDECIIRPLNNEIFYNNWFFVAELLSCSKKFL